MCALSMGQPPVAVIFALIEQLSPLAHCVRWTGAQSLAAVAVVGAAVLVVAAFGFSALVDLVAFDSGTGQTAYYPPSTNSIDSCLSPIQMAYAFEHWCFDIAPMSM